MNKNDKNDKEQDISWNDNPDNKIADEPGAEQVRTNKPKNVNLTVEEMKTILIEYQNKFPEEEIEPLIIEKTKKKNRFYILKAISMAEVEKIDELFEIFQKDEVTIIKKKARVKFCEEHDYDIEDIPETAAPELQAYLDNSVNLSAAKILQSVNDLAVNMVSVVWPQDHNERVTNKKVPAGDIGTISIAAQVLSGFADVSTDIEAYSDKQDNNETSPYDELDA